MNITFLKINMHTVISPLCPHSVLIANVACLLISLNIENIMSVMLYRPYTFAFCNRISVNRRKSKLQNLCRHTPRCETDSRPVNRIFNFCHLREQKFNSITILKLKIVDVTVAREKRTISRFLSILANVLFPTSNRNQFNSFWFWFYMWLIYVLQLARFRHVKNLIFRGKDSHDQSFNNLHLVVISFQRWI